jgi:thioredoxin 1
MKFFLRIMIALSLFSAVMAANAVELPFTQAEFKRLNDEGKTYVVHVGSKSCSTCQQQRNIASKVLAEEGFEGVTMLKVDFDNQKEVLKKLNVMHRSTFILIAQGKELERMIGGTDKAAITSLLSKAR